MENDNREEYKVAVRPEKIIEARFSLTNRQNNILDVVLSKLKNDDNLKYTLDVKEFEELFTSDTSNIYRDFKKAVDSFKDSGVTIVDENNPDGVWFAWFSKIKYRDKEGKIDVNIDVDFKKILYEVKKSIFYDISYTLNMKSSYSQRIYYYAKSFESVGWRIDCVDDLVDKLEAPESYKSFANLNRFVLEKAKQEVDDITDIIIDFEAIKTGRRITHVKTIIKSKDKNIVNYEKMSVDYILNSIGGLINGEEDANKILKALELAIEKKYTPASELETYFQMQIRNVIEYSKTTKKEIPLIALIITAIKNNWKEQKPIKTTKSIKKEIGIGSNSSTDKQLAFCNFEAREMYSNAEQMKELEFKLLGWDKDEDEE